MEAQPKCNLIIDSCCDLPFEVIDRPGVQLLEFPYIDEKGEHSDDLYRTITPHEFYEGMRAGSQPSTAQVPVTVFQDVFSKAIESGVPTVYLSFTSGLSGSFNTAVMMRDQLIAEHPEAELYVVDTYLASVAEALLSLRGAQPARQRHDGARAGPRGPRRRATSSTPSSWSTIWNHCAAAAASPAPLPTRARSSM